MTARSYLYVPATRADWMRRALDTEADAIILDLEDSVTVERKGEARTNVRRFLRDVSDTEVARPELWVRLNAVALAADVAGALSDTAGDAATGVVLPGTTPERLAELDTLLEDWEESVGRKTGSTPVIGLIETAEGVATLRAIAEHRRTARLGIGEADLAADLSMHPDRDRTELWPIRTQVVVASAAAGLGPPVGPVETDLGDSAHLASSTERLHRQGFSARTAIHPKQLSAINEVFTPNAAELEAARALLADEARARSQGEGVLVTEDGQFHDPATLRRARRLLGELGE